MFRRIAISLIMVLSLSFSMSAVDIQKASKNKLGCIKGLGVKRVEAIILYRKKQPISSLDELLNIKGIGKVILKNITNNIQKKICTDFTHKKNKERVNRKKDIKAE